MAIGVRRLIGPRREEPVDVMALVNPEDCESSFRGPVHVGEGQCVVALQRVARRSRAYARTDIVHEHAGLEAPGGAMFPLAVNPPTSGAGLATTRAAAAAAATEGKPDHGARPVASTKAEPAGDALFRGQGGHGVELTQEEVTSIEIPARVAGRQVLSHRSFGRRRDGPFEVPADVSPHGALVHGRSVRSRNSTSSARTRPSW